MDSYLDLLVNDVRLVSQPKTPLVIVLKQQGGCELSLFKYLSVDPVLGTLQIEDHQPGHLHVQEGKVRASHNLSFWMAHLVVLQRSLHILTVTTSPL
jgi:hypothetical protein